MQLPNSAPSSSRTKDKTNSVTHKVHALTSLNLPRAFPFAEEGRAARLPPRRVGAERRGVRHAHRTLDNTIGGYTTRAARASRTLQARRQSRHRTYEGTYEDATWQRDLRERQSTLCVHCRVRRSSNGRAIVHLRGRCSRRSRGRPACRPWARSERYDGFQPRPDEDALRFDLQTLWRWPRLCRLRKDERRNLKPEKRVR